MIKYILILILYGETNVIHHIELANQAACEYAEKLLDKRSDAHAYCIPTEIPEPTELEEKR